MSIAGAVLAFWLTLYISLPTYPPSLGLPLAFVAILFLITLALLHQTHADLWPRLAQVGFIISAVGLGLWVVGGTLNTFGRQIALIAQPQPGWGLLCVGLMTIGLAAIRSRLSLAMRCLLPLGGLFLLGEPLKYVLGAQAGGLTVLFAFGAGWLAIGVLLLRDRSRQGRRTLPTT
jgi:hypothetical protein